MKHYVGKFVRIFIVTIVLICLAAGIAFGGAVLGYWGDIDDLDVDSLTLNQNSVIVYTDPSTGEEKELQRIDSTENREWTDIENIPYYLQKAFISIEDERFMDHKGYDLPRTVKATLVWVKNKALRKKGVSLGGSTITQQLIKNVTGEKDQTPVRKVREISRAVALEKEFDKTQILELYLNCIYLSHGCNGVQTAAKTYFGKDVGDLNLAECASIAGITQNPANYDPIDNPNNNAERRKTVLGKMLDLGYISQNEYDEAVDFELQLSSADDESSSRSKTTSYFADQVISEVLRDLQEQGYSKTLATNMLYSGGLKILSTYNPDVQNAVEDYYSNTKNFAGTGAQSAITILDVQTGQIVGIAGGIGEKTGSLTLNRASGSPRQPGSTIKPIAAYAPALENNLITPGSIYDDKPTSYDGWTPRNYDYTYRGDVDIRTAVRKSLNTIPVEIINQMGPRTSYDFLTEKMGITTLVESREINGKIYGDIGLSQLALGGLTDGTTTLEMAAAYSTFANGGIYYKPYSYTEVRDRDGNIILSADRGGTPAIKPSTAFLITEMLKEVVSSGTGGGAAVNGVSYTAGKTGTTSENNDRWFIGYTPYYVAAIWYGYDIPQEIRSSSNPCIPVFRSIMNSIHSKLPDRSRGIERPGDVVQIRYCTYSGMRATSSCPSDTYYFSSDNIPAYCNSGHEGYVPLDSEEDGDEEDEENGNGTTGSGSGSHSGTSGGTSGSGGSTSGSHSSTSGGTPGGASSGTSSGTSASGGLQE